MRIDEHVGHVLESVALALPLAGAHEAVAENAGAHPPAEFAEVVDQLRVGTAEVVRPEVGYEALDVCRGQAELLLEGLVHLPDREGPEGAAAPHLGHPLVELARTETQGLLPPFAVAGRRRQFENAADIEDHRVQHPGTLTGGAALSGPSHDARQTRALPRTSWITSVLAPA